MELVTFKDNVLVKLLTCNTLHFKTFHSTKILQCKFSNASVTLRRHVPVCRYPYLSTFATFTLHVISMYMTERQNRECKNANMSKFRNSVHMQ